jgi:urease accessory protein
MTVTAAELLRLLQLASPALPVGAYSYSEGVETLIHQGHIRSGNDLAQWIQSELSSGAMRLDAAVMVRAHRAWSQGELELLDDWNQWLSATRETEELRQQSWQMGRSLLRLLGDLDPGAMVPGDRSSTIATLPSTLQKHPCNFAIAFGIAAAHWQLPVFETTLVYLQSWVANLISAGVRLVPLGQTEGQRLLGQLIPALDTAAEAIVVLPDDALTACSWGLTLASMAHETQYSRLFRS